MKWRPLDGFFHVFSMFLHVLANVITFFTGHRQARVREAEQLLGGRLSRLEMDCAGVSEGRCVRRASG